MVLVDYKGAVIIWRVWEVLILTVGGIQWLLCSCECCKGSVVLGPAKFQYNELKSQHVYIILSMPSSSHLTFSQQQS